MTALGRYRIIQAQTIESLTTHRLLIEKALTNRKLPPALRAELEKELQQVMRQKSAAKSAMLEIPFEEEEEDEDEGSGDGGSGDCGSCGGGDQQGSSDGSGGGMMGAGGDGPTEGVASDSVAGLEMTALLFYLAEHDVVDAVPVADYSEIFPLAAATILFNRVAKTAHIHEPYTLAPEGKPDAPSDLLPVLEQHAARMGARVMQLRVHEDAVNLFKNKGYVPQGKMVNRQGTPMQRMRRTLPLNVLVPTDMT